MQYSSAETTGSETLVHIPCPNGHLLETPPEMFGQDVMCPHCQAQFQLKERESVEYKRREAADEERFERRRGKLWLNWAVSIAVVIVLGLIAMIWMVMNP